MNTAGWLMMLLSMGIVFVMVTYCLVKVLTLPPIEMQESLKGPLDIDTLDTENAD